MNFRIFSILYPKKVRNTVKQVLVYSDLKVEVKNFMGFIFFFSLLFSLFLGFIFGKVINQPYWIITLASFIIVQVSFYLWLLVHVGQKAQYIENVLPDALLLMASNLRAGYTTDKAFLLSARPEFGPLKEEITQVGKEIVLGKSILHAFTMMKKRIKSKKLARTIELIVSGVKSGGGLADLLQETAKDFKKQQIVDKKIRASVNIYVIFIFIAIAFGSPLLFGLSSYLVEILVSTFTSIDIPSNISGQFSLPISVSDVSIEPSFIIFFALFSLAFSSFFGAMIIGLISKGEEKAGIPYIPILMAVSIGFFFLVRFIAKTFLGGLFGA